MNDTTDRPDDFDATVSSAFEPMRSIPTPDIWHRVEPAANDEANPGRKPRWGGLAVAAALLLVVGGAIAINETRSGQQVDVVDQPISEPVTTTTPRVVTTIPPVPVVLEGATWVRIDPDVGALVSDVGQSYPLEGIGLGGGRIVSRLADGTVVVAASNGVTAFEMGAEAPVNLWPGAASELRRNDQGDVIAITDDGPINLRSGSPEPEEPSDEERPRIVTANGFAVEVVPGEYELDATGEVADVIRPDALRLLFDDAQSNLWEFGGPAEYRVVLDDFNGRYVLAHRRPDEPAVPPSLHVVIDIFNGRTESFVAVPGTVALTAADTDERPSSFSVGALTICPTMSPAVLLTAPNELSSSATNAFDRAALAISRCDETWLRGVMRDGTWDDAVWEHVASALRTVPRQVDAGWLFGEETPATVSVSGDGEVGIELNAGSFELRITKFDGSLVLAGSVGPETAAGLLAAANQQVGADQVWDFGLSTTGSEMDETLRQGIEEMIGTGFNQSPIIEALVTPSLLRVISQDSLVTEGELTRPLLDSTGITVQTELLSVEPTDAERSALDALQTFAAGGPLDPGIEWADQVIIGAGPLEGRRLTPSDVTDRSNWIVENIPFFRASGEESFTTLTLVPDPSVVGGPHNHCASPPIPAPPSLAGLRRVSIQPVPDTIDSCLQWRTFDVFFNADNRIAGVTVDWWEP